MAYIKAGGAPGSKKPSQSLQLEFYGLFKQITEGPNKTKAPSRLKLIERAKWDAWTKLASMGKEEAKKKYVETLNKSDPGWKKHVTIKAKL